MAGNKIAFANKVFAALYGELLAVPTMFMLLHTDIDDKCCTPEDLIGSYHNFLLRCDECDGKTRCTHRRLRYLPTAYLVLHHLPIGCRNVQYNRDCLETNKPVEYEELAILKDGLQVSRLLDHDIAAFAQCSAAVCVDLK